MVSIKMKLIIYTDGASRGNPGIASYGFFIQDDKGNILYEEGKYIGIATNNFAEYSAVLASLKYVLKRFSKDSPLIIDFYVDSQLVAQQLSGKYKIKSASLKQLILQIKNLTAGIGNISFHYIPRAQNKRADKLANQALDNRLEKAD